MDISKTTLDGVFVITPRRFTDARGYFSESWNRDALRNAGLDLPEFVQDNHSLSHKKGTLRGLHYQAPPFAQGKLVRCGRGALFDVAVDIRQGSPSYGAWFGTELSEENGHQLWVPAGFLHGFITRADNTEVLYKCTAPYNAASDGAVHWDSFGIDWGQNTPHLSEKDAIAPALAEFNSPFQWEVAP